MSTEAHSLHTDREVGQRTNIRGAYNFGSRTLKDLDMTALDWSSAPVTGVVKHSDAHAMWPLGGTYVMDWNKHAGNLDVKGWGQQIPQNGLALWLRADSIDVEDGQPVTEWRDQSGNGHVFSQGTASAQPSFVADGGAAVNNKPLVDCDGNDLLSAPFSADLNTNSVSVFVVAFPDTDDGNIHGIIESRSGVPVPRSGFNLYARMDTINAWQWWGGDNTNWRTVSTAPNTAVGGQLV